MLFFAVVLEKTHESSLVCKEIKPVSHKGNQSRIIIERNDPEAEAPILWPPGGKNWLIGKDSDAGKDWRQEEKGMTEDEMVGWQHRLDGHELEQALGVGEWQGSLASCSPWGCKESDTTEWLNWSSSSVLLLVLFCQQISVISQKRCRRLSIVLNLKREEVRGSTFSLSDNI